MGATTGLLLPGKMGFRSLELGFGLWEWEKNVKWEWDKYFLSLLTVTSRDITYILGTTDAINGSNGFPVSSNATNVAFLGDNIVFVSFIPLR